MRPGVLLAVALALRLAWFGRGLDAIDRAFIPDDTYYLLSVARSLGAGDGPVIQGVATSGFQPLAAWLLAPFAGNLVAALLWEVAADASTCLALAWLANRLQGPVAAWVAGLAWAASPIATANALGGLETSLALAMQLWLLVAWWRMEDGRGPLLPGVLAGLALLARVDTVPLVGLLCLVRKRWAPGLIGALIAGPWWAWCAWRFGSPLPESGAAMRAVVAVHQETWLTTRAAVGWAAGAVLGPPYFVPGLGRDLAKLGGDLAWGVVFVGLGVGAWRSRATPLGAFGLHLLALLVFYTFYLPATWFLPRYLAPVAVAATLGPATDVARRWNALGRFGAFALVAVPLWNSVAMLRSPVATRAPDEGATAFAADAQAAWALLPPGAVVGSQQSGALAWFAPPGSRVVNLDGVVDREASAALREGRMGEFARDRGVTHLVDWAVHLRIFAARGGATGEAVGKAGRFVVVESAVRP